MSAALGCLMEVRSLLRVMGEVVEPAEASGGKPQPGMLLQARKDTPDIDFSTSAIIGDSLEDMAAGTRMGCRTIMIADPHTEPDFRRLAHQPTIVINAVAESLHDAVVRHVLQC